MTGPRRASRRALAAALALTWGRSAAGQQATPMPVAATLGVPVSLTVANAGDADDRLIAASSPVADRVELRTNEGYGAERRDAPLPDGISIRAGATVILEPLGDHLALVGLRRPLAQGETFPLTLRFAHAGEVTVTGRVRRKLDAAGVAPIPPAAAGALTVSLVSAPPAPGPHATLEATPAATPRSG